MSNPYGAVEYLHPFVESQCNRNKPSMGRFVEKMRVPLGYILGLILIVGCASPQKARYVAPSFDQVNVHTITILPIVDSRTQRMFEVDETELQRIVYPVVESGLNEKGYRVEYSDDIAGVQCLKFGRSLNLESECLRKVGPSTSRWVLVLFLQDFQMRTPYGGAATAKMSGILFDRSDGLLLWSDLEYAGLSQRELVGPDRNRSLTIEVLEISTRKLISSLPKKSSTPEK
jgi:hypothetical protein